MKKIVCHDIENNEYEVDGNQLMFRPSAYGLLIEDGKILLSKQFDGYDFPGGGVDVHETIHEAVRREFFEETGLEVEVLDVIHCETSFFHPAHSKKCAEQFWHSPLMYFLVKQLGGTLSTDYFDEEEKEYAAMAQWVRVEDVDNVKFINSVDSPALIRKACQ